MNILRKEKKKKTRKKGIKGGYGDDCIYAGLKEREDKIPLDTISYCMVISRPRKGAQLAASQNDT